MMVKTTMGMKALYKVICFRTYGDPPSLRGRKERSVKQLNARFLTEREAGTNVGRGATRLLSAQNIPLKLSNRGEMQS